MPLMPTLISPADLISSGRRLLRLSELAAGEAVSDLVPSSPPQADPAPATSRKRAIVRAMAVARAYCFVMCSLLSRRLSQIGTFDRNVWVRSCLGLANT